MCKIFVVCACATDAKGRKLSESGVTAVQRVKVAIGDGGQVDSGNVTLMAAATGSPILTARLLGATLSVTPQFERWLNADTPGGQQQNHWRQTFEGACKRSGGKSLVVVAEADTVSMMLSAMAGVTLQVAVQPGAVFSYHHAHGVLQQDLPIVHRIHTRKAAEAPAQA